MYEYIEKCIGVDGDELKKKVQCISNEKFAVESHQLLRKPCGPAPPFNGNELSPSAPLTSLVVGPGADLAEASYRLILIALIDLQRVGSSVSQNLVNWLTRLAEGVGGPS